jgi:hypothetical protein
MSYYPNQYNYLFYSNLITEGSWGLIFKCKMEMKLFMNSTFNERLTIFFMTHDSEESKKEIPAGVADSYTEKIKERRSKEPAQGMEVDGQIRQIKHVSQAMLELIENIEKEAKKA